MSGPAQAQLTDLRARVERLQIAASGTSTTDTELVRELTKAGVLTSTLGAAALMRARRGGVPVAGFLRAEQLATPADIARARAALAGVGWVDLTLIERDRRLLGNSEAAYWLRHTCLPIARKGDVLTIVCADPLRPPTLPKGLSSLRINVLGGDPAQIERAITDQKAGALIHRAETLSPQKLSSRRIAPILSRSLIVLTALCALGLIFLPHVILSLALILSLLTVAANAFLRVAAINAYHPDHEEHQVGSVHRLHRLPKISILLPVFHEGRMLANLIRAIDALDYPRALMDVIILIEENDSDSRSAALSMDFPPWIRSITVPQGTVQTKPRAMNYALPFCRGSIVGIYDAEDRPAPDQLRRVADRFAFGDDKLACIQGVLGFYNTNRNWISRAFSIEYASWFRVVLPGIAALGVPVPLGGTTVFATRRAIENAGGWDAHNVTEDADLGIRFARAGLRTEVMSTLTEEEANFRAYPWIKQRSRWLKGYAMTWVAHMQNPARLWRELGPSAFLGFNAVFLGTLMTFAGAPLLWSLWLVSFGIDHPSLVLLPGWVGYVIIGIFVSSQAVQVIVTILSLWRAGLTRLILWVPVLTFYWPLATLACYKALAELITRPFYWDKTAHGIDSET